MGLRRVESMTTNSICAAQFQAAGSCAKTCESVEKLDLEKISFGLTSPCCATGYSREEQRR
jgi:hypothetical protein